MPVGDMLKFEEDTLIIIKEELGSLSCEMEMHIDDNNIAKTMWETSFLFLLTDEEKKKCIIHNNDGYEGHLWHGFSNELVNHLEKDEADSMFLEELKNHTSLVVFFQDSKLVLTLSNVTTADCDLLKEFYSKSRDVYITDSNYRFTYVNTHEVGWFGPYFTNKQIISKSISKQ